MNDSSFLQTALEAAKRGGAVLKKYFDGIGIERHEKDDQSYVTKADGEAEEAIVSFICERYPDHGVVGEEGTSKNPDARYQWVIDPLDATRNFSNGIPVFAVSIALIEDGKPLVGVVYNPATESLYAAERGKGMSVNGKAVRVSVQPADKGMATFAPGKNDKERVFALLKNGEQFFRSVRYLGCTALELAYVARGGTEAFLCLGLKKWDYAAGRLLVEEAGGTVTDLEGNPCDIEQNYFIASNGLAHNAALNLIRSVPA
jgi:myo-inositol-1(or 4)-monophosphatase